MPAALTLILICPSPGSRSGIPAHFNTSGGPYPVITTALGIAVPSFLVAASVWPRTATSACSLCAVSAPSIAPCDGAGASRPRSRARSPKPAGRELMAAPARPSRVSAPRAVSLLRPDETLTVECTIGSREQSSPASPSTRCSSALRPLHGLDCGDLRGLGVNHAQSRMLGRELMGGLRIADRAHGCTCQP